MQLNLFGQKITHVYEHQLVFYLETGIDSFIIAVTLAYFGLNGIQRDHCYDIFISGTGKFEKKN